MTRESFLHYRIEKKLGEGGMGEVFLATDTNLDRRVAIKFLPERISRDPEARERLIREAKAASRLNHPNILTIHAVEQATDRHCIVMEYIEGRSLEDYTRAEACSLDEVLKLAVEIGDALGEAHAAGITHRDVKPSNILVDTRGSARVLDFGLAKIEGAVQLTQAGSTVGTIAYSSPEQTQGKEADHRSDLFSLGILLYEMITGRRPFQGEHEAALVYAIAHEEPEPLARFTVDAPAELQRIVSKCLNKEPGRRYQSMADLVADLRSARESLVTGPRMAEKPSIAVLPFTNMSADPENEYFSDGLAEELINALTHLKGLRVVARTSSFAFKGKEIDVRELGERLSVDTVLEGSVRKAGNRLRITAQLISVQDGYHLWSERFDREMEDIFAIQDEISHAIAKALQVTLIGAEESALIKRHTEEIEAYNLHLRGRYFWSKRTEQGLLKGIECFDQAIGKDPEYALAYVGLADSYSLLCCYHIWPPDRSMAKATAAAHKAMTLNPDLADSHEATAHVRILEDWKWALAEREFRRAIELNPSYATAHQRLALLLTLLGRLDEAQAEIARARELEPLSLIINVDVGLIAYIAGQSPRAIEECQNVLEMAPDFGVAHFVHGLALEGEKRYDEAIAAFHKAKNTTGGITVMMGALGHAYAVSGRSDEARMILEEAEEISERRYVSPYSMATIHLGLGDHERALQYLARACEEKSVWLIHLHLKVDPRFESLRSEPRFQNLLKTVGL